MCFLTVCSGTWTKYYDRDDPANLPDTDDSQSGFGVYGSGTIESLGGGDYENLVWLRIENSHEICVNPTAVDARVVGNHTHYSQTGQTLTINPQIGLKCENDQQANGTCLDYEVRFCCPSK